MVGFFPGFTVYLTIEYRLAFLGAFRKPNSSMSMQASHWKDQQQKLGYRFPQMEVSWNRGTPIHHPFIDGFSIINHPAMRVPPWRAGTPQLTWENTRNHRPNPGREPKLLDPAAQTFADASAHLARSQAGFARPPLTSSLGTEKNHATFVHFQQVILVVYFPDMYPFLN